MDYKKGKRKHCRSETKALHNGTKVSTLTRAEKKNSWSLEAALHSGLWKRWREQHGEGGRVIIISVFTRGTCSCKVQRRRSVIWPSRCSISRASTVPFPSSCLKGNINNVPPPPPPQTPSQMLRTLGKDKLLQHQAKDHPSLASHLCVDVWAEGRRRWIYADTLFVTETKDLQPHQPEPDFLWKQVE